MIEFKCNSCGSDYRVNRDKIGKRGKCPNCSNIMIVPESSSTELIFDESQLSVGNSLLQNVYDTIQTQALEKVKNQYVLDRNIIALEVVTGDYGERSQIVAITVGGDDEEYFLGMSTVGAVSELTSLETALRYANEVPLLNVGLDEENKLQVKIHITVDRPPEELMVRVLLMAAFADKLEEEIFGWDIE